MKKEIIKENKVKRGRSSAYPAVSLKKAVETAVILSDKLGSGPYSREAVAQALGYKGVSGASAVKVAALVHFGLLNRKGSSYHQSNLSKRILVPKTEEDKKIATAEALLTPTLYAKLSEKYSGNSLPTLLENILYHEFNIMQSASKEAAENFRQSAEFAGFLKNGILLNAPDVTIEPSAENIAPEEKYAEVSTLVKSSSTPKDFFQVKLPSGITALFPQDLSYNFGIGEFAEPL